MYDFHDGSSDLAVWAADSKSVFYTAKVGSNVELFRVPLDGKPEQLTDSPAGAMHYHPYPSPDGKWLVYGSKRDGVRQLYVMRLSDKKEHRITDLKKGHAAMWAHWQPDSPSGPWRAGTGNGWSPPRRAGSDTMRDEAGYVCDSCGEEIVVPVDLSAGSAQEYVEDCPVCCRPNVVHVEVDEDGDVRVWAERE